MQGRGRSRAAAPGGTTGHNPHSRAGASTLIESCFSVFQALKGKDRSSLGDGRVLEALLSREAVDVFANGAVGFDELRLRDDSRNHRVPW